ncbi:hypothetical protein [Methanosarcina barkeri]|uniref:hypothetical protein n=1 Tax=Methanosarcina barkeri TaxID=2208 RepID=UPI000A938743|nr:hypothetical protein [Methanosarcina barkeri]
MPATLLKKLLARNPFEKGLTENPEKRLSLKILSSNPIGVITTLFKKMLDRKPRQQHGRRDQTTQRKLFQKGLDQNLILQDKSSYVLLF